LEGVGSIVILDRDHGDQTAYYETTVHQEKNLCVSRVVLCVHCRFQQLYIINKSILIFTHLIPTIDKEYRGL